MKKFQDIKLVVMDVDGTMTNGEVYMGENGELFKKYNIKDGLIIKLLGKYNIDFMILTGRNSESVKHRGKELDIRYICQNVSDKEKFLKTFMTEHKLDSSNLAYIGDDLNDYKAMKLAGFSAAPKDAAKEIRREVNFVSDKNGGEGAVRDILEYMMTQRGDWNRIIQEEYGYEAGL